MNIAGLEASSVLDYPKKLCSVFFCQGCNYDCFYCHNRSLIGRSTGILGYQEIQSFLLARKGFIQAVVVSGGEPTLQKDLLSFIGNIRNLGFAVKLDTNGSKPEVVERLLDSALLSYAAVDVKAPFERYTQFVGGNGDALAVKQSVALLNEYHKNHPDFSYEVRTTLAPTLAMEDLCCMVEEYPPLQRWYLQEYRLPKHYKKEDEKLINLPSLSRGEIEKRLPLLRTYQPNLVIR
ncbi:MAG: anaerobic ribonucleoside-triphosphate reductase activating protein [Spirochaetales bacterium]|nr:anaerobic ribonucleoside-triphosphate reductase activating protein [Spirochaetales bacterium]